MISPAGDFDARSPDLDDEGARVPKSERIPGSVSEPGVNEEAAAAWCEANHPNEANECGTGTDVSTELNHQNGRVEVG